MSCVEKHALLLKYKLYVNAVVAELAGLRAGFSIANQIKFDLRFTDRK